LKEKLGKNVYKINANNSEKFACQESLLMIKNLATVGSFY